MVMMAIRIGKAIIGQLDEEKEHIKHSPSKWNTLNASELVDVLRQSVEDTTCLVF